MLVSQKMNPKIQKVNLQNLANLKVTFPASNPFENLEYFHAMESSDSASEKSGWIPNHLGELNNDTLNSFLPLYKKFNSYGEFIFDQQWAHALQQTGRDYYPKLLTAIPFTPCEGERILAPNDKKKIQLIESCIELMQEDKIESWHILFPNSMGKKILRDQNFIERFNYRFVWHNNDFQDFDEFLAIFTSRQRATIRKERKSIEKADIEFKSRSFDEINSNDWDIFYNFYRQTYFERGQNPYLTKEFFYKINTANHILKPVIFFAYHQEEVIASSLCFEGKDTLYGRHWGTLKKVKNLHFECCYYQGIEYCIKNGIDYFDPGVQGEHKIRRGFQPKLDSSFHYFLKNDFGDAVSNFCKSEKKQIENYIEACKSYTPFNKDYKIK
jgi:predicted N-acyltransferase